MSSIINFLGGLDNKFGELLNLTSNNLRGKDSEYRKLLISKDNAEVSRKKRLDDANTKIYNFENTLSSNIEKINAEEDASIGAPSNELILLLSNDIVNLTTDLKQIAEQNQNKQIVTENKILYNNWVDDQKRYLDKLFKYEKVISPIFTFQSERYWNIYNDTLELLFNTKCKKILIPKLDISKFAIRGSRRKAKSKSRRKSRRKTKSKSRRKSRRRSRRRLK